MKELFEHREFGGCRIVEFDERLRLTTSIGGLDVYLGDKCIGGADALYRGLEGGIATLGCLEIGTLKERARDGSPKLLFVRDPRIVAGFINDLKGGKNADILPVEDLDEAIRIINEETMSCNPPYRYQYYEEYGTYGTLHPEWGLPAWKPIQEEAR